MPMNNSLNLYEIQEHTLISTPSVRSTDDEFELISHSDNQQQLHPLNQSENEADFSVHENNELTKTRCSASTPAIVLNRTPFTMNEIHDEPSQFEGLSRSQIKTINYLGKMDTLNTLSTEEMYPLAKRKTDIRERTTSKDNVAKLTMIQPSCQQRLEIKESESNRHDITRSAHKRVESNPNSTADNEVIMMFHLINDITILAIAAKKLPEIGHSDLCIGDFIGLLIAQIYSSPNKETPLLGPEAIKFTSPSEIFQLIIDFHEHEDLLKWINEIRISNDPPFCLFDCQFLNREFGHFMVLNCHDVLTDFINVLLHTQIIEQINRHDFFNLLRVSMNARNLHTTYLWIEDTLNLWKHQLPQLILSSSDRTFSPSITEYERLILEETKFFRPFGDDNLLSIPKPHFGTIILTNIGHKLCEFTRLIKDRNPYDDLLFLGNLTMQRNPSWEELNELEIFKIISIIFEDNKLPISEELKVLYHTSLQKVIYEYSITNKVIKLIR